MQLIGDTLKTNIPEFLSEFPSLKNYLGTAGDFLEETKNSIDGFQYSHDFELSTQFGLEKSLESIGFNIPPNLKENIKRDLLRDATESFLRGGTEDSLLWVLRVLGVEPNLKYAWLPSPEEIRKGYIVDPVTKEKKRYDVNRTTYADFLYGKPVHKADGTYFEGYRYTDQAEQNLIQDLPIFGEKYDTVSNNVSVAKTPYVVIQVDGSGFSNVIETDNGQLSENEFYESINQLLEYFLYKTNRPSPVKILILVYLQSLEDALSIDDSLLIEELANLVDSLRSSLKIQSQLSLDVSVPFDETVKIGTEGVWIGNGFPYKNQFSAIANPIKIGENTINTTKPELSAEQWESYEHVRIYDSPYNSQEMILLRLGSSIEFRAPFGSSVQVKAYETLDSTSFTVLQTVQPSSPFYYENSDGNYHKIVLDFISETESVVTVTVTHPKV